MAQSTEAIMETSIPFCCDGKANVKTADGIKRKLCCVLGICAYVYGNGIAHIIWYDLFIDYQPLI